MVVQAKQKKETTSVRMPSSTLFQKAAGYLLAAGNASKKEKKQK
jgi:hypothetical protein